MRLLFDEDLPYSLAAELTGHECDSVIHLGWRGTSNGELLSRAEKAGFDVLLTLDRSMKPEQNMQGRRIAVLVVRPGGQGKVAVRSMATQVLFALASVEPGSIVVVSD